MTDTPRLPGPDLVRSLTRSFQQMSEGLRRVGEQVNALTMQLTARMREAANDPVHVAGIEGRYYVRAAMHPLYADPIRMRVLVGALGAGEAADTRLMTTENRALVVAAAMRGWEAHRG